MKVLVACEFSGIVREAFRSLGHDAYSCDILPTEQESPYRYATSFGSVLNMSIIALNSSRTAKL